MSRAAATPILLLVCGLAAAMVPWGAFAGECKTWPAWESFRDRFSTGDGRVVDPGTSHRQTTSEGQAYALFFALVADDRAAFDRILRWTQDNLADGDLTGRLPAWQWGRRDDGTWGVIDENGAADSDLWIAYTLGEAGALWKSKKFSALGELIAMRILREETAILPGLGRVLLPAPRGFHPEAGAWRLNPSYVPIQVVRSMMARYPASEWASLLPGSVDLIVRSSPRGFAPEWIVYREGAGFQSDEASQGMGSFNAIRVYLWAGMLAGDDPVRPALLRALAPMGRHVAAHGVPPLEVDTRSGIPAGAGPAGFSAALLPFLAASRLPEALRQQRLRTDANPLFERADNYYDQVLALFGLGWIEGRYRFTRDGRLVPRWKCTQKPSR